MKNKTRVSFIFFLLIFTLIGCGLFNSPLQDDYYKKIDTEIAWAHAAKLTVHINYDLYWGTSNPGRGQITPAKDIRQGYEFDIEFIPDTAYTLTEWRAFSGELPADWTEDLNQFEIDVQGRELTAGSDFVLMSSLSPRGGNNTLKINTLGTFVPGTITLVPWCITEPRILRTEPRFTSGAEFSKGALINIYFNSQLKESSVHDAITIWNTTDDVNYLPCYTVEYFEVAGQFVVTLTPKTDNLPEINKNISVTIKTGENGIANLQGEWMSGNDVVYSWKTLDISAGNVSVWGADYYESDNTIVVSPWTVTGDYSRVEVSYTLNRGPRTTIAGSSLDDRTISGVGKIIDGNVRQGIGVSGVQEYEIIFDIYAGTFIENSRSFKIWNIPGMSVSSEQGTGNINEQLAMSNEQIRALFADVEITDIVLTSNITLSNWQPVDLSGKNFYGNGNAITIKSFDPAYTGEDYGLFGVVGTGAVIRDLTVVYEDAGGAVSVSLANEERFGGIAGTVSGGAVFENVLVKGAVIVDGSGEVYAGGMVGHISSTATNPKAAISNAYSELNLTANINKGFYFNYQPLPNSYIGGAVGTIGKSIGRNLNREDVGAVALLEKISVVGDITAGESTTGRANAALYAGGLAAYVCGVSNASPAELNYTEYKNGTITINTGLDDDSIGGVIGYIAGNADIQNSSALAESIIIDKFSYNSTFNEYFLVGGFVGNLKGTNNNVKNCCSENPIVTSVNGINGSVWIGGFVGELNVDIAYCYAKADVNIRGGTIRNYAGGFAGQGTSGSIKFCYASGNVSLVTVERTQFNYGGGFAGYISSCQIAHSYALGDVYIDSEYSDIYAGGFIGNAENSVENCFALGTVIAHCFDLTRSIAIGGLIGLAAGKVEKCVVAVLPRNLNSGMSLVATGGSSNRRIGRIYGRITGSGSSNNYAWNGIRLFSDPDYDAGSPIADTTMTALTRVHDGKDGEDANSGSFRIRSNWEDAVAYRGLGYTENVNTAINGVTKNYPAWNFTDIVGRGYPRIKTEDGGIMGGQ